MMKNSMHFAIFMLCFTVLLALAGCSGQPEVTTPSELPHYSNTPTESASLTPQEIYTEAVTQLASLKNYTLEITTSKMTTVGAETYWVNSSQSVSYLDFGLDTMKSAVTETLDVGSNTIKIKEYFYQDAVYLDLDGRKFSGKMDIQQYCTRYAPAALLDAVLYSSITVSAEDPSIILFSNASGVESWADPHGAALKEASGSAKLGANGQLIQSTYSVTYQYGPATIQEEITAVVDTAAPAITAPEDLNIYLALEHPDAVRCLEVAYGYLISAGIVTATTNDAIVCQAGGLHRSQTTVLNTYNQADAKLAEVDISVSLTDYSKNAETTTYNQVERYINSEYSIAVDGGASETSASVTAREMQVYCQDYLVNTIMLPEYITSASMIDLGSTYLIEFTGSDVLAEIMCNTACNILYENPYLLDQLSTASEINDLACYLAFDKYTGLPTASGISFSATHSIEGYPYLLTYQIDQSYTLASLNAYEAITGTQLDTADEMTSVTPPLYRVADSNGGTLWLFGTIYVGDRRISILPDEVMDAFSASDALAVDFDINSFENLPNNVTATQQKLAAGYYSDGTLLSDHLDAKSYDLAVKYAKAAGLYSPSMSQLKPVILENGINNFFVSQGYTLSAVNDVEAHLLALARNTGKEILSVEPAESQITMITVFSDATQAYILNSTLEADAVDVYTATHELYEFWCAGNEDALREVIKLDSSEMRDADKTVYEEYWKAMSAYRDLLAVNTAVEYLTSGKTVFMAVDFSHLLAEDGLVNTLRNAGYTVTQITYE